MSMISTKTCEISRQLLKIVFPQMKACKSALSSNYKQMLNVGMIRLPVD